MHKYFPHPASCRVLQALQGGTHDKNTSPLRADAARLQRQFRVPRRTFPRHDGHRLPRTGLSSWGEQAPRARASFAEKPCQLRTESGTRFQTWRSRDDIVVFWEVIRTCSYFPLHAQNGQFPIARVDTPCRLHPKSDPRLFSSP